MMALQFLAWYLIVLLIHLLTLPLTLRLFAVLPDHGYALGRSLGILLTGYLFWLGYSLGVIRNETGGAWLSLLLVAVASILLGRTQLRQLWRRELRLPVASVIVTEGIFLSAFLIWATVRAYNPSAAHTEQPMDLMFMNSLWNSPTFPPQDGWLAGYAISYYYFGYWLVTMVGRLAAQPPEIAYNLGQACWWALLLIGCFGVVFNLLARPRLSPDKPAPASLSTRPALFGGLLASLAVGVTGNLQGIMEWLYAVGLPVTALAKWFDVANFPEGANVTGQWFISQGEWWWWRSSRVIEDLTLTGEHIEVIDEFPSFSYILGDNHPHVLAMPFVLLVIGLALALFWRRSDGADRHGWRSWLPAADPPLLLTIFIASGALVFLNTWDFPPYWLLLILVVFFTERTGMGQALRRAALFGALILASVLLLYFPYFLTAQSQAGGFVPNFFNPTRLPQFLLMFGVALLTTGSLLLMAWRERSASWRMVAVSAAVVLGAPLFLLVVTAALALTTPVGRSALERMALPEGATSHLPFIVERWSSQPWTFLLLALLLSMAAALLWVRWRAPVPVDSPASDLQPPSAMTFTLLLAAIGLLLVYAPEFVFLRDNFGTRMNTIFKFYYQAWLLFGLSGAFAIVGALQGLRMRQMAPAVLTAPALLLILGGLIYPLAGVYSRISGFDVTEPSFDATAYLASYAPAELAAVRWMRDNAPLDARVAEAKGRSYASDTNRISTMTGRATLHGWDGHESQWRGRTYGEMAAGRSEALTRIYRTAFGDELRQLLADWQIDYVYIGPIERNEYGLTAESEARLADVMQLVFEDGNVRIYQRR
jgi:YYY domain-containing protein